MLSIADHMLRVLTEVVVVLYMLLRVVLITSESMVHGVLV
jgi:hypothetical protein